MNFSEISFELYKVDPQEGEEINFVRPLRAAPQLDKHHYHYHHQNNSRLGGHVKSMMTIEVRDRPEKIHVKSQGEPIEVPRALASVHVKSDLRFGFEL